MSIAWSLLEPKLQRFLKDTAGTQYDPDLRLDAINAALEAFAAHTAKAGTATLTGDGSLVTWSLPADCLESPDGLEGVWDAQNSAWLEEVRFSPGDAWSDPTPQACSAPRGYYLWPAGTLNTTFVVPEGQALAVYYYAYWEPVTAAESVIAVPQWGQQALLHYAAAYCLTPSGLQAATIRQYNQDMDSGNPEHNPVHEQVEFHLKRYQETINRFQPQQRGMRFTPGRAL